MPGPPPQPTRILEMRGSWRAGERQDEPEPERTKPLCPKWIQPEAKRVWKEIVPQLQAMGVLGKCDRNALMRYCQLFARWRAVEQFGTGDDKFLTASVRLSEHLSKLEQQFGLTPSARARLAKPAEKDPHENRGKGVERFFSKNAG